MQEALDYLALLTKSYWKPINANTIFVTMDNANKRRDYEDEVTKIFYLRNIASNPELTAIVTAVRTVADLQRLFPFEGQWAIIAKGRPTASPWPRRSSTISTSRSPKWSSIFS